MQNETDGPNLPSQASEDTPLDSVFQLRKCLRFEARLESGTRFVVIEDPVRCKFFRLGASEYEIVAKINGRRSNREILNELQRQSSSTSAPTIDEQKIARICHWLVTSNLVTSDQLDTAKRVNQQSTQLRQTQFLGRLNPISIKVNLFNPNQLIKRIHPFFNWIFSAWFFCLWLVVGGYALSLLADDWARVGRASANILSADGWLWLLVTWFILKIIHEAAHGIACRRYGGEVPRAGILLLLFAPMAFVDVTSMWRFNSRWQRIVVAAAGMYIELFVAFIAVMVWYFSDGILATTAFNVMLMSSVTTVLFNANPLMRFDGYFILSDSLAIANLYQKGTTWFSSWLLQQLIGLPNPVRISADEQRTVVVYGCLAFLWKISVSVGLVLAASVLLEGLGLIFSAIGVGLWFVLPLVHQAKKIKGQFAMGNVSIRRASAMTTLVGLLLFAAIYWFQAPAIQSAPAVVQFKEDIILRAGTGGFIQDILVTNGQRVSAGQTLAVLENPQLTSELLALQRRLDESRVQTRIYQQQQNQALAQAEAKRCVQLQLQIQEKESETQFLQVQAPSAGVVVRRDLANLIGSFVSRGDPLVSIVKSDEKEIIVSVDQSEYDADVWQPGKTVRVLFPGQPIVEATVVAIDPRANQAIEFPSLAVTAGGDLPVRPITDDTSGGSNYELLSPRFAVTVCLPNHIGSQVATGQRGQTFFRSSEQSLASYIYLAARNWLETKIELSAPAAN